MSPKSQVRPEKMRMIYICIKTDSWVEHGRVIDCKNIGLSTLQTNRWTVSLPAIKKQNKLECEHLASFGTEALR